MAITTQPGARAGRASRPGRGASVADPAGRSTVKGMLRSALNAPLADFYLVAGAAVLLLVFGTMMVLSASSVTAYVNTNDAYFFVKRQLFFLVLGLCGAWWLARRPLSSIRWLGWAGLVLAVVLLVATFVPGIGHEVNGNRNWINVGPLTLQPSEFAKVAMIVWGADLLHRKQKLLDQPKHLMVPLVPVCLMLIALVVLEKDLGTAMVMMLILLGLLWVVGTPVRLLMGVLAGVGAGVAVLVLTSANRMERIFGFLNPEAHHQGVNMQPAQGIYSLAAGGWWGRGLGFSRGKWGMVSESHTDYVFAVLGEELGLVGTISVVLLFGILGFAGFRIAMRSDTLFPRVAAAGITLWFTIQAFINIAVVLRMLPVAGVPLPFVSYGGSALLASLLALGILLSCARQEPAARRMLARHGGRLPRLSTVVDGGRVQRGR